MTLTARDKKIMMLLAPIVLLGAFWFLLLAPKREEAASLGEKVAQAQSERETAEAEARSAQQSKGDYSRDYATVVRLGKAAPADVDLPSLIVQLDQAARGTEIRFAKIATGEREAAPAPAAASTTTAPPADGAEPAAEAGGEAASTGPGQAAETANEGAAEASASADASATADPAAGTAAPGASPTQPSALETIPLDFTFRGSFFDLADFFHEMKRFVRVANGRIDVNGRLMTIDGFSFEPTSFPQIRAEVQASVYLAPKAQGTTAGATPSGPGATTPAAAPTQPSTDPGAAAAAPPPAAAATPAASESAAQ